MVGPQLAESDAVHFEKYRHPTETFFDAMERIARTLGDSESHKQEFLEIISEQRFLPAGRIQAGAGSSKRVTLFNCYVSPTIEDSFVDGNASIMDCAKMAAATMRQGGGIGYDFSSLRPKGDFIKGVQSHTDGPLAFMPIFDGVCKATSSAGNRRGAQMGILRIDHPDIFDFIKAKRPSGDMQVLWDLYNEMEEDHPEKRAYYSALQHTLTLTGFNISVAVTDQFMECLSLGKPFPLQFQGRTYSEVDPEHLWDALMQGTYDWAEPGVIFIDTINKMNNLYYCEKIAATNPCGEQPLPPYGACLLGSFNLVKYLRKNSEGKYWFDYDQLRFDIPTVVRAMDNVIEKSLYPLKQQEYEAISKRRLGLGVTGLANCIEAIGYLYGSSEFLIFQEEIMSVITHECYRASIKLAAEKGAFPLFDNDKFLSSEFVKRLPDDIHYNIAKYGIRNSHLTSIAPTGTISFCADNVSSGIEPVFAYKAQRKIKRVYGEEVVTVDDYGVKFLKTHGKTCDEITPNEHVATLVTAQTLIDSAVSKTCNVPHNIPYDQFKSIYSDVWQLGGKGCTTYRPAGREGILQKVDSTVIEGAACQYDPQTGSFSCEN